MEDDEDENGEEMMQKSTPKTGKNALYKSAVAWKRNGFLILARFQVREKNGRNAEPSPSRRAKA